MLTYPATNDTRTTMTNSVTAMLRNSLLLASAVLLLGCGSSSQTTELEERRPLLECDGGRYDEYLTVTATARSLQLDLVRRKVLARGQARLAGRVRSSIEGYLNEERPEVIRNSVASGLEAQATDSLESSINRAVGEVLAGSELTQCNTYAEEQGEARLYVMDAEVGLPIGEAASEFAQRVGQNPTLQEAFEDQSEIREVIRQWLRWSLTRDVTETGTGQSGASRGGIPN
jgi:hypothetical protein